MKAYAGLWKRIGAFALDYIIILIYLGVVTLLLLLLNSLFGVNQWLFTQRTRTQLVGFLLVTLPVTLYFAFSEASVRQATWGKQRLGLKVTTQNGNRIGLWRSVSRTALKFIPWELAHTIIWQISFTPNQLSSLITAGFAAVYLLIGANIISLILRKDRRTLYDLLAGTCVVKI